MIYADKPSCETLLNYYNGRQEVTLCPSRTPTTASIYMHALHKSCMWQPRITKVSVSVHMAEIQQFGVCF